MKKNDILDTLKDQPNITWIILGFLISYLLLFIYRTFINVDFMLIPEYIPRQVPIGWDLKNTLDIARAWLLNRSPIYDQTFPYPYPPFVTILVIPLTFLGNSIAYRIITLVNLVAYIAILAVYSKKVKNTLLTPISMFMLVTGLFSYGFLFELERGQFNIIAASICFLAIYIFHYREKYRIISYLLFIISVQIKVWPLIFIVMFIDDWKDWKNNLKRFILLGIANFAMLFILGAENFKAFVAALVNYSQFMRLTYADHSILSFASSLTGESRFLGSESNAVLQWVLFGFLMITLLSFSSLIYYAFRNNLKGMNPTLLLACTIGALIIPISYDYTLSILPVPVLLVLANDVFWNKFMKASKQVLGKLLLLIFSISYASTLFSFSYRPSQQLNGLFATSFLALFVMLLILNIVQFIHGNQKPDILPQ